MIVQKSLSLNVGVDLRGPDVGVTKHFLHGANISAAHQQMCGEGMTKDVGSHVFLDSGFACIILDQHPDHLSGNSLAAHAKEEFTARSVLY